MQVARCHSRAIHACTRARVAPRRLACNVRTSAEANGTPATSSQDQIPLGCARYSVSLKKPLGVVLEQDVKSGNIFVVEVKAGGSAALDGRVKVGDQLIATSGVIYTTESDYGGAMVKGGQQLVRLRVAGETFKTVSAAIGSHPGHMPVTLEFQRCDGTNLSSGSMSE
ncbi:hypothetical protein HYH02_013264 [Chlamydomonas schloesseri]|uniref:PDZ domain-containing protein n=1 Tax=Chlamydomonas schloesseri TaxID=2026947 RepID=A0A835SUD5_9CHLO|nr:hypothetical protein HYH02_013264 [Chlamydomonas schloesseri]|eukprot:KAG2431687.1 hypothetical protein HYH02_013264 [Chlamydomonas schloesseri]